ncbi:DUF3322 and DUF2220 domain-containing protein, partial [Stenotrophomonas sp. YIM B06876]|uniref:Wadjet anti-phage system protein JetD domain-containing protein n=1 Tax=Stenotrophomonas sp. YIM B06876 TaxID=3060211 RepID=UPI002738F5B6
VRRAAQILQRWPQLGEPGARLRRQYPLLADWVDADITRLLEVVDWLQQHPDSDLYLRQLPIAGIDSKWVESRRAVVADLLAGVRKRDGRDSLDALAGLRTAPDRVRLRLLDPALRALMGGLEDLTVPVAQLARMKLPVRQVLIVENRETGLASGDLPGTLVLMARGYAVSFLERIEWLRPLPLFYWGDIDTHGLAILHRLRHYAPQTVALLMDAETLRATPRELWGHEEQPQMAQRLDRLTPVEHAFYDALRRGDFGPAPRLEQERIAWNHAWARIAAALGSAAAD